VSKGKLDTFKPQRRNANRHTQRGLGALETSIQKDGWIGAITVAADGETFDGSARIEVGASTGFDDVIVVESDGTKPIVHRRIDIPTADDPRAKRLGLAANRVAALNLDFDPAVILADLDAGLDLSSLWNEGEIEALIAAADVVLPDAKPQAEPRLASECFIEIYCSQRDLDEFGATLDEWSKRKGVTVNIS
jgi:hypothetical protein